MSMLKVTNGSIVFTNYNELLEQAKNLEEFMDEIEVTEENLSESKKLATKIRKKVTALEDERKSVKREFMKPINDLDEQIKEISQHVMEAESKIRLQLQVLEEKRRDEKESQVRELFDKRINRFESLQNDKEELYGLFFKPQYLNKSFPLSKVEKELVEFLEKVRTDYKLLADTADNYNLDETKLHEEYRTNGLNSGKVIFANISGLTKENNSIYWIGVNAFDFEFLSQFCDSNGISFRYYEETRD